MKTANGYQLFINGQWQDPDSQDYIPVINPSTEQLVTHVASANEKDINAAVIAAENAFHEHWRHTSGEQRSRILEKIADAIDAQRIELAQLETTDNGKPLAESIWDIEDAAGCFRYYAAQARHLDTRQGKETPLPNDDFESSVYFEPIGVCALIIPWNYPLLMAAWKVAPALAAGCSMVLKPSELTPLSALKLAEICLNAGLPRGVLNVVTGYGAVAGQALVDAPQVRKIAFTGSSTTGASVMKCAANAIKNVSLELGGKSPIIVFKDCDLDKAVEWIMFGIFWNQGEVCSATSRLLVEQSISEVLFAKLKKRASAIVIGDGQDDGTQLGPLVSKSQYDKVMGYIALGIEQGAQCLFGGKRPAHLTNGYFVEPTLLFDDERSTATWREEIFGPVLVASTFMSESEAIMAANDSDFGLGAAVLSEDLEKCERVARSIDSGIIWVNCSQPTFTEAPWGGMKRSGIGRELGQYGIDNYLEVKQVTRYMNAEKWDWYK